MSMPAKTPILDSRNLKGVPEENLPSRDENAARIEKTRGWITAEQTARFLHVGVQTVKTYERNGRLHPIQVTRPTLSGGEETVALYDPKEADEILLSKGQKKSWSRIQAVGDTSQWLTRAESTVFLSCSPQTLKSYEKKNRLHPLHVRRRDLRGREQIVVIYNPDELNKLPKGKGRSAPREQSTVESRAFELFSQNKTVREVVIEMKETSERIRDLYQRWIEDGTSAEQTATSIDARVFELFNQGKSNQEIVIALGETSDRIRDLRDRWIDDGGADLVIGPIARASFEKLVGTFKDVAELLSLIEKLISGQGDGCAP
jgi:hypothetical protein